MKSTRQHKSRLSTAFTKIIAPFKATVLGAWRIIDAYPRTFSVVGVLAILGMLAYSLFTLISNARGSAPDFIFALGSALFGALLLAIAALFIGVGTGLFTFSTLQKRARATVTRLANYLHMPVRNFLPRTR